MKNYKELGRVIGKIVNNDESVIRTILKRNGLNTTLIQSKKQLANTFVKAMFNSKAVANDLADYLKDKIKPASNSLFLNATEEPTDEVLDSANSASDSGNEEKEGTWFGNFLRSIDYQQTLDTLLDFVANSNLLNDNGIEIDSTQEGADETVTDGGQTPNEDPPKPSNTMLYVVIGSSAVLIATTVFLLMKNRKK